MTHRGCRNTLSITIVCHLVQVEIVIVYNLFAAILIKRNTLFGKSTIRIHLFLLVEILRICISILIRGRIWLKTWSFRCVFLLGCGSRNFVLSVRTTTVTDRCPINFACFWMIPRKMPHSILSVLMLTTVKSCGPQSSIRGYLGILILLAHIFSRSCLIFRSLSRINLLILFRCRSA